MFLRSTKRKKDGKEHRYFSIVENRRLATGGTAQRTVLYLGEINDKQEEAWQKSLSVFDEGRAQYTTLSLFPDDRPIPTGVSNGIQVRLGELELRRPRVFGNCWLACALWRELGLDQFWQERFAQGRESIRWEKVLQLLVVNRLIAPGSEFYLHRHWFLSSAMDELLDTDFAIADKDRLYRCLDRILEHKQEVFTYLRKKWADLFQADFDVLLYDLTSTYFEGEMEQNPKAKRGYSRDGRRLSTGRHRLGRDEGWFSPGVRSYGWQHFGSDDAAQVSQAHRKHLWSGEAHLGHGPRYSHRSGPGRDANRRTADLVSGRHAEKQDLRT
jgi:hypothetical protein